MIDCDRLLEALANHESHSVFQVLVLRCRGNLTGSDSRVIFLSGWFLYEASPHRATGGAHQ